MDLDVQQVQQQLVDSADYIDHLHAERDELIDQLTQYEKEAEARKLAWEMVDQGAIEPLEVEVKTAELFESEEEDFDVTRRTVELYGSAPPTGFAKVASAHDTVGASMSEDPAVRQQARVDKFYAAVLGE